MAATKRDAVSPQPKHDASSPPLGQVMREFEILATSFEAGLLCSLEDTRGASSSQSGSSHREHIRREACRLAITELSQKYMRKHIGRSLDQVELEGQDIEDQLRSLCLEDNVTHLDELRTVCNGYFRLFSSELFHLLGKPSKLRLGTLRFYEQLPLPDLVSPCEAQAPRVNLELALNDSFFVADSHETLPYHTFRLPTTPSLQNRGILSRRPEDNGAFPEFDSWLLFTFLGNGCIKVEVPIEMCAHIYGSQLDGRENEEVLFWGFFVNDNAE